MLAPLAVAWLALALPQRLEVPSNEGWVTDLAELLDAGQEAELERLMESYKAGSQHEIALLTIASLGGDALEDFALRVGREWEMGREGVSDAAVLVVARDERELRIEVGRGLEGTLTDSISGRIIRDVIVPQFKQGRWYDGLRAGIEAMHAAAGGDYGALPVAGSAGQGASAARTLGEIVLALFVLGLLALRSSYGRRRGRGRSRVLGPHGLGTHTSGWGIGSLGGGSFGGGGFGGGGGFSGFGGGGGFSGGGASGRW
jgi:uncharacterized protein